MDGRERAIILAIYLGSIAWFMVLTSYKFLFDHLDFDSFKGEYLGAAALLTALLIKLPPTKTEAEAQVNAGTDSMNVQADDVTVTETNGKKDA